MKHLLSTVPKTIWGLGFATLLLNFSTIMIFSLSPLYLTQEFGVTCLTLGSLEGIVECVALFMRMVSGVLTDAFQRRKILLLSAVGLTMGGRILFPLASNLSMIFGSRVLDRIANGLQATPREALIGDWADPDRKGEAYGLRESLGKVGSFLGAAATMVWLHFYAPVYRPLFWIACLTPFIAWFLILTLVHDKKNALPLHHERIQWSWASVLNLSPRYWRVLAFAGLFALTNYSGAFLILQGKQVSGLDEIAPLLMILQNSTAMMTAYPIGRLFDQKNHRWILSGGIGLVVLANLAMMTATSSLHVILGALLWGGQMAVSQSLLVAKIAGECPHHQRGMGFAIYYLIVGVSFLTANAVFGWIADTWGLPYGFLFSTLMAFLALLSLLLVPPQDIKEFS